MRVRGFGFGVALATLLASASARADENDAEAQFAYGLSEMIAGRYPSGCPALAGSFRLDPRPGTLFTLAECLRKWGRTASALASYDEYLAIQSRMAADQGAKQGERVHIASEARSALQATVPRLACRLPEGTPPGAVIERDDFVLSGPMLGAEFPVDPGEHVVRLRMPDGRTSEQKVTLVEGESRLVVAALPSDAPTAAPPPSPIPDSPPPEVTPPAPVAPPTPGVSHRPWTFVALGVGAAGFGTAAVTLALALAQKAQTSGCNGSGVCTSREGVDAGNMARGMANAATVGLIVGAVGLVGAIVLELTEPKAAPSPLQAWLGAFGACPGGIEGSW
jgi:hypothetical protein